MKTSLFILLTLIGHAVVGAHSTVSDYGDAVAISEKSVANWEKVKQLEKRVNPDYILAVEALMNRKFLIKVERYIARDSGIVSAAPIGGWNIAVDGNLVVDYGMYMFSRIMPQTYNLFTEKYKVRVSKNGNVEVSFSVWYTYGSRVTSSYTVSLPFNTNKAMVYYRHWDKTEICEGSVYPLYEERSAGRENKP